MKSAIILVWSSMLLLASCKKTTSEPITTGPEPQPIYVLASDSIAEGHMEGIMIGSPAEDVYAMVQNVLKEYDNKHLHLVRSPFLAIEDLKDRLHLYNQLLFDETVGTDRGVQVYFEDDRIKSIWTNNGEQLNAWPKDPMLPERLKVGDPVSNLYPKLLKLSHRSTYANRFQRISLFDKNAEKPYDTSMSASRGWYFSTVISEGRFHLYHLDFESGILVSIKRDLMGPYQYMD